MDEVVPPLSPESVRQRRRVLSSGLWVATSTTVPLLATAALSVVAGRVLGPELLGLQSLIAFAGQLASGLLILPLTEACIRALSALRAAGGTDVEALERWAWRMHLLAGTVGFMILLSVGLLTDGESLAWALVALSALLDATTSGTAARIVAKDGWGGVARRRLVTQLVGVAAGIVAVLAGAGIAGIFAGNVLGSLLLIVLLARHAPARPRRGGRVAGRAVLSLTGTLVGAAVLSKIVGGRVEILFLGVLSTGEQTAQYTVAIMLVIAAITLPTGLASAAMPAFAAASGAGREIAAAHTFARVLRITAVLSLPLTAATATVGPVLVRTLYGEDFAEAARLSQVVALLGLTLPCARMARGYWAGLGRMRLPLLAGAAGAVIEIVLAVLLIPGFEAAGAVTATVVGQSVVAVALVGATWRSLAGPGLHVSGWVASACAAAAAASLTALVVPSSGILATLAAALCASGCYLVLVLLLRSAGLAVLREDDSEWLAAALPGIAAVVIRRLGPRRAVRSRSPRTS